MASDLPALPSVDVGNDRGHDDHALDDLLAEFSWPDFWFAT
jgi:hypothetical protein